MEDYEPVTVGSARKFVLLPRVSASFCPPTWGGNVGMGHNPKLCIVEEADGYMATPSKAS